MAKISNRKNSTFKRSPLDFFSKKEKTHFKKCDYPGCDKCGEYKAPKSRADLKNYYWFCLEHVTAYNKSWDYYAGMSEIEYEIERRKSLYGDRPTWNYTSKTVNQEDLLNKVFRTFGIDDETPHQKELKKNTPELKAILDLGLQPPVTFKEIKKRYRKLVKIHHPDINKDPNSENKIKKINQSYTLLKATYSK